MTDLSHYTEADNQTLQTALREFDAVLPPAAVRVALDVGSRDALIARGLARHYPHARVWAFECNPAAVTVCRENMDGEARIELVEAAVTDKDGPVTFYPIDPARTITPHADGNIGASSLYKANADYPYETYAQSEVTVNGTRLDTWARGAGVDEIDVLWMDVQGAELSALTGLGRLLPRVKIIHVEVQYKEMYLGASLFGDVDALLTAHGFVQQKKLYACEWFGDVVYVRGDLLTVPPMHDILRALPHVRPDFPEQDWFTAPDYYPYYEKIGRALSPRSVLEIGALQGFSQIALLRGAGHIGSLTWVDSEEYIAGSNAHCRANLEWYGRTFAPEQPAPALKAFGSLTEFTAQEYAPGTFDVIHIDGEHTYAGKQRDLELAFALRPQAILLDDYYHIPEVTQAIKDWARQKGLDYFVVDTFQRGLAVFDLSDAQDVRAKMDAQSLPVRETVFVASPAIKTLVLEPQYGGLGDHLFFSHLPRLAKQFGGYDKVFVSTAAPYRSPDYKRLVWDANPYVDGFTHERGPVFDFAETDGDGNLLDYFMRLHGMDDGLRGHEPELYFQPTLIPELVGKTVYDPNFVSYVGDLNAAHVADFFADEGIRPDFQMARRGDKGLWLDTVPGDIETTTLDDFCSVLFSCKEVYCLASGTATLAAALGKRATVLSGPGQKPMFHHSPLHRYVSLPLTETGGREGTGIGSWLAEKARAVPIGSRVLDVGAERRDALFTHGAYFFHDFAAAGFAPIPAPDASFDAVVCPVVLEHAPDPVCALREVARLLRPGGTLLLTTAPGLFYTGLTPHWFGRFCADCGLRVTGMASGGVEAVCPLLDTDWQERIDRAPSDVSLYRDAAWAARAAGDEAAAVRFSEDLEELDPDAVFVFAGGFGQ